VMVTFVETFTSEDRRRFFAERAAYQRKMEYLYPGEPDSVSGYMTAWDKDRQAPKSTLEQVADHIDHIRDLIGVDHIGIGGDYDGISTLPLGLEDVSTYPDLFAELLKRGYSAEDLRKIAGLNMLRVMRDAEEVSLQLRMEYEPSEVLISDFD
jgi:membrane dipeptidase